MRLNDHSVAVVEFPIRKPDRTLKTQLVLLPHELLELHPPGTIVHFLWDVMHVVFDYMNPYLELDMCAVRAIVTVMIRACMRSVLGSTGRTLRDAPSPSMNKKLKDLAPDGPSVAGGASPPWQLA